MKEKILTGIFPSENILPDDYPVNLGYYYVCDGRVRVSPIGGWLTVKHLKYVLDVSEIRRCDTSARNLF